MGNQERGRAQAQNDAAAKKLVEYTTKIAELEKRIHEYKQGAVLKSQQNGVVQEWIGKSVHIEIIGNRESYIRGILKNLDRYTYCVEGSTGLNPYVTAQKPETRDIVVHKGAVAYIFPL
jgi:hypothetical protein